MGYIIILLSPSLGLSTSVMFAILGLIIVLNDKEKTK